jgi:hypothetical protein
VKAVHITIRHASMPKLILSIEQAYNNNDSQERHGMKVLDIG